MPQRIDHVIIAGPDLDTLEERFTSLGFFVTGGGTHPHLGTRNRIIILDQSYIELLAPAESGLVSPALQRFIASGGGWVGYALQSDDIAADTIAMRARGADARGPTPGRLVAPDGTSRSWRVTMLGSDDLWEAACPLPFLIQHDTIGEAHRLELAGPSGLTAHTSGASYLDAVHIYSRDTDVLADRYRAAYDLVEQRETNTTTTTVTSWRLTLASGEYISIEPLPRFQDSLGQVGHDTRMSVRVHVGDLAAIEALHWHATVASTRDERTLMVRIPGVDAEIECTGPRHDKERTA